MIKHALKVEDVSVDVLSENPANTRTHNERNIQMLMNSLSKYGQRKPIVVQKKNMVIRAGNGLFTAVKQLGWEKIAAVVIDESSTDATGYEIMDNRSAETSDWDFEILGKKLAALKEEDFDLDMVGFSDEEFGELLDELTPEGEVEEDEAPEAVDDPVVKTGDLWLLGDHRLLCGDCTKVEDVERVMCGEKADMVYADPPYGINLDTDYSGMKSSLRFIQEKGARKYPSVINDNKDYNPEHIFEMFGYCKEIFLWGADYYAERILNKNKGSWFVWDKRLDNSADKMFGSCFELCWSKTKHKREIARIKWCFIFGTEKEFDHKRHHPTQKPIALSMWFINKYSKENDIIWDGYLGSGSTLLACEQLNRRCYGLEISPAYCQVILERYRNLTNKEPILEATGKSFSDILPKELT